MNRRAPRGKRAVVFVGEEFPQREPRVRRQARALVRAGVGTLVVHAGEGGLGADEDVICLGLGTGKVREGGYGARLRDYMIYTIAAARRAQRIVSRWRPTVVQIATPPDWLVVAGWLAGRKGGWRAILDVHDPMPELIRARRIPAARVASAVARAVEGCATRWADKVLVPTWPMAKVFRVRHPGREVIVVPNAADGDLFRPDSVKEAPRRCPVVIYHGTVARRFGVDVLVRAIAYARRMHGWPGRAEIIGDGPAVGEVRALVAELGIGEIVRVVGGLPQETVAERVRSADIGVVPYRDSAFMRLAYSTKAYEYAAVGVPPVLSDLPSLREQLRDCGIYVEPGDPAAWGNALVYLSRQEVWKQTRETLLAQRKYWLWETYERDYVNALGFGENLTC